MTFKTKLWQTGISYSQVYLRRLLHDENSILCRELEESVTLSGECKYRLKCTPISRQNIPIF